MTCREAWPTGAGRASHTRMLPAAPAAARADPRRGQEGAVGRPGQALLARVRPRIRPGSPRRVAVELIADLERIYQAQEGRRQELAAAVKAAGTTDHPDGIGPSGAARRSSRCRRHHPVPRPRHFASWNGTGPSMPPRHGPDPGTACPAREPADPTWKTGHGSPSGAWSSNPPPGQDAPRPARSPPRKRPTMEAMARPQTAASPTWSVRADGGRRPRRPDGHREDMSSTGAAMLSSCGWRSCRPTRKPSGCSRTRHQDPTPQSHPILPDTPAAIARRRTAAAVQANSA